MDLYKQTHCIQMLCLTTHCTWSQHNCTKGTEICRIHAISRWRSSCSGRRMCCHLCTDNHSDIGGLRQLYPESGHQMSAHYIPKSLDCRPRQIFTIKVSISSPVPIKETEIPCMAFSRYVIYDEARVDNRCTKLVSVSGP
jgi:hypothetical protein